MRFRSSGKSVRKKPGSTTATWMPKGRGRACGADVSVTSNGWASSRSVCSAKAVRTGRLRSRVSQVGLAQAAFTPRAKTARSWENSRKP